MKKFKLAIVQSDATQFDGPLFRKLSKSDSIELIVYFTGNNALVPSHDPELNRKTGWDHDISSGYQFHLIPPAFFIGRLILLYKILSTRHDLIIVAGYVKLICLIIALLCRLAGVPVGLRSDSTFLYQNENSFKWKLKDIILPWLFKLFTTGHPTGSLAKTYLIHYGFSEESLFLYPYNVDNDYLMERCNASLKQQTEIKSLFGIDKNDFMVLGVLKFVPREDPITLLNAFARIVSEFPDAHLIMVGDGELSQEINRTVRKTGIKNVHLPGYVPYSHLPWYYGVAAVFVHPAIHESWGVSVNEAMACGVPVITADTVGAGVDLIVPGQTGLIFKAGDSESLAACIVQLISNPNLRKTMNTNARERISDWSYSQTEKSLIQALQYITTQRKG